MNYHTYSTNNFLSFFRKITKENRSKTSSPGPEILSQTHDLPVNGDIFNLHGIPYEGYIKKKLKILDVNSFNGFYSWSNQVKIVFS